MEACCQLRTGRTLAQQYNHLLVQEEVEPPELTAGTRRIPVDKVSFADELSECDGLLQFYMPVTFDPDAVFGTHVATAENDDWLNVYAAYDLNTVRLPVSAGQAGAGRAAGEDGRLLPGTDRHGAGRFPGPVSGGGTAAPPGPQPGPAVSTPSAPCAPCVPVSGRGRARAPPRRETAPLGPVSPRFGAFDFSTRIKERRGEPRRSGHKALQCGAFPGFGYRRR